MKLNIPITRADVLSALGPVISVISGGVATYLLVHVHVLGIFVTDSSQLAALIASVMTFGVTAVLVWLSTHVHWRPMLAGGAPGGVPVPPFKKIMAWLNPYTSVVAGAVAAWLAVNVHVLGIFHVDQTQLTQTIAAAIVFGIVAVITWLAHHDLITAS